MSRSASLDTSADRRGVAAQFLRWADAARVTAQKRGAKGDRFGVFLAIQRAEVYSAAARIVGDLPSAATAGLPAGDRAWLTAQGWTPLDNLGIVLMRHAMHCAVQPETGWTLADWDRSGAKYVRARAWQLCAWELDSSLPEVQPEWS
jgi:hypothetical protein